MVAVIYAVISMKAVRHVMLLMELLIVLNVRMESQLMVIVVLQMILNVWDVLKTVSNAHQISDVPAATLSIILCMMNACPVVWKCMGMVNALTVMVRPTFTALNAMKCMDMHYRGEHVYLWVMMILKFLLFPKHQNVQYRIVQYARINTTVKGVLLTMC